MKKMIGFSKFPGRLGLILLLFFTAGSAQAQISVTKGEQVATATVAEAPEFTFDDTTDVGDFSSGETFTVTNTGGARNVTVQVYDEDEDGGRGQAQTAEGYTFIPTIPGLIDVSGSPILHLTVPDPAPQQASTTFEVKFRPAVRGPQRAILQISWRDGRGNTDYSYFKLVGTGSEQEINVRYDGSNLPYSATKLPEVELTPTVVGRSTEVQRSSGST